MSVLTTTIGFWLYDNVRFAGTVYEKDYAKITGIKVQDIARQIWYSWDGPTKTWNKTPEVQAGVNNLYVAFYAMNPDAVTRKITLMVGRVSGNVLLARKVVDVDAGAGVSLEWTGDVPLIGDTLELYAVFGDVRPGLAPAPTAEPVLPSMPVMPAVEIPNLPWYASWLTPIIQYIANFGQAVINYVVPVLKPVLGLSDTIAKQDQRNYTVEENRAMLRNRSAAAVAESLSAAGGSEAYIAALYANKMVSQGETIEKFRLDAAAISTVTSYFKPETTLGALEAELQFWFTKAWQMADKYTTAREIGAFSTLVSGVNVAEYKIKEEEEIWGFTKEMGKINEVIYDIAINERVRQRTNLYYPFKIPDATELINEVVKEVITLDDFKGFMRMQGFAEGHSQHIWDAHYIQPAFQQLQRSYWRGYIKLEELPYYLKLFDLDPRYNEKLWMPLFEEIPPFQELVNERVKEVTTQEQFEKGLAGWGYKGESAKRIWDAHFMPASWTDFLTAMRRKQTVTIPVAEGAPQQHTFGVDAARDIEVVKALSVLADYDPRYWDFFKTRIYGDPSPRMSMWAYDAGAIDEAQMREMVHRYGYTPDAEKWYGDMLIKFQERPWVTRYLTALQTAYIDEAITAEELEARVVAIPRNKSIAAWMVKIADVRKEILAKKPSAESQKLLTDSDLKKGYLLNIIDSDKLRAELMLRGYQLADIEILIEVINEEKQATLEGGMKKGLTIAELFDAMRYEFKTEQQVLTELLLRGMTMDDAQTLISVRKAKWVMGGQVGGEQAG